VIKQEFYLIGDYKRLGGKENYREFAVGLKLVGVEQTH
jgi:hypothetical protein